MSGVLPMSPAHVEIDAPLSPETCVAIAKLITKRGRRVVALAVGLGMAERWQDVPKSPQRFAKSRGDHG